VKMEFHFHQPMMSGNAPPPKAAQEDVKISLRRIVLSAGPPADRLQAAPHGPSRVCCDKAPLSKIEALPPPTHARRGVGRNHIGLHRPDNLFGDASPNAMVPPR